MVRFVTGDRLADNATLAANAIIGVIVDNATFRHYGRLSQELAGQTDEVAANCIRMVS
jgi:hypothetical protein